MAKTRQQKELSLKQLQEAMSEMKSLIFINYCGLKIKDIVELRSLLKSNKFKYLVTKKTLLKLALKKFGLENINLDQVQGGTGLIFGYDDEVGPAKIITAFSKKNKQLSIQGGIYNKELVSLDQIKILATLPSKNQLIAQLLGTIKAPISNLVYTLKGNTRNFVYLLSVIKK
ncbi:MAG: 50S ribosomal protein L10 [Patescibacteria group bacterium]